MAILIIGGCGFIGSHVAEVLAAAGEELVILDRNGDDPTRRHAAATYIKGDFGNRGALSGIFESNRVDRVVHLAASTLPGSSNRDPEFGVRSNVAETAGLLELCVRFGTKKILFLSSGGTVYGIPRYMPVDERHPTDPISSYGISKLSIESTCIFTGTCTVLITSRCARRIRTARGSCRSQTGGHRSVRLPYAVRGGDRCLGRWQRRS